jgi:hypothetical protein
MPKRSRKPASRDFNQIARSVVDKATGVVSKAAKALRAAAMPEREKDPAAVALGRKGGLKGGKARAAKLTKEQRSASAKKAAAARWAGRNG